MNHLKTLKKWGTTLLLLVGAAFLLSGCARPNEENVKQLLSRTYQCQWLKLNSYEKVESLAGIWSYVVRYKFDLEFHNGDEGAKQFMQGMYKTTPGVLNWEKVFENPKAHAYIRHNCSLPAQKVIEQVAIHAYMQMNEKKNTQVEIPKTIHVTGWAEMSTGRSGWNMDMRRDKVDPEFVLAAPLPIRAITAR